MSDQLPDPLGTTARVQVRKDVKLGLSAKLQDIKAVPVTGRIHPGRGSPLPRSMNKSSKVKKAIDQSLERDVRAIREGSRREISPICQRYLKALVDTRSAPKVGVPTNIGGHPGRTAIVRYTQQIETTTAGSGIAAVSIAPLGNETTTSRTGPFLNTSPIVFTDATFTGTTLPAEGGAFSTGVQRTGWTQSTYDVSSMNGSKLLYRLVGCTLTVFPDGSFSTQNGRIVLCEAPSHASLNDSVPLDLTTVQSFPQSRVIRAVQTGAQSEKIVLNWHPKSGSAAGRFYNDFDFRSAAVGSTPPSVMPPVNGLLLVMQGNAATSFHIEVTAMYEVKGTAVPNLKPRLVDSRGMDLIQNSLACKLVDGYVGKPEHVYESYLSHAWTMAKKATSWIRENEKQLIDGAAKAVSTIAGFI